MSDYWPSISYAHAPLSVTGTSAQSAAIGEVVGYESPTERVRVELIATTDMHVLEGVNPTATTNHNYLIAFQPKYLEVQRGNLLAAIRNTADGSLYITEMK